MRGPRSIGFLSGEGGFPFAKLEQGFLSSMPQLLFRSIDAVLDIETHGFCLIRRAAGFLEMNTAEGGMSRRTYVETTHVMTFGGHDASGPGLITFSFPKELPRARGLIVRKSFAPRGFT
jgi:hypothetical protein